MITCGPGGSTTEEVFAAINEAQLKAWDSVASAMTADSYANQPAGEFVIAYASNDDGTYTGTPTTDYSAVHYVAEASAQVDEIQAVGVDSPVTSIPVQPNGDPGIPTVSYDPITGLFSYGIPVGKTGATQTVVVPQGAATVAEMNAITSDPTPGDAWWMLDAGTITYGDPDKTVAVNEVVIWVAAGYFFNAGVLETGSSWDLITGVTVGGYSPTAGDDLLPTTGGKMSAKLEIEMNIDTAQMLSFISNGRTLTIQSPIAAETSSPFTLSTSNSVAFEVDGDKTLTVTEAGVEGVPPTAAEHLTRKDYVDGRVVEVTQAEYDALTPDESVMYAIIG